MKIGKIHIFTLVIIVFILLINLFYIIDTEDDSVIANVRNLIEIRNYNHWFKVGATELKAFNTDVTLAKGDNPNKLTYSIEFDIRYKKENVEIAKAEIDKLRTIKYKDFHNKENLTYISSTDKDVKFENYLVFVESPMGKSFRSREDNTEYLYGDFVTLQFNTDIISGKYIEFVDFDGKRFLIKTNPMLVLGNSSIIWYTYVLIFILGIVSQIYGGFLNSIFVFVLFILSLLTDHVFLCLMFLLFVVPIIIKVKLERTSIFKGKSIKCNYKLWSLIFLGFASLVFLFIHNFSVERSSFVVIEIIASIIITFVAATILFATAFTLGSVYIYLRYKEKNVESIEINNIREELIGTKYRKFPVYKCDVVLNGKTIIENLEMGVITYRRLINNSYKNTFIKKYKTDDVGNYIFY